MNTTQPFDPSSLAALNGQPVTAAHRAYCNRNGHDAFVTSEGTMTACARCGIMEDTSEESEQAELAVMVSPAEQHSYRDAECRHCHRYGRACGRHVAAVVSHNHPCVDLPAQMEGPRLPTTYSPVAEWAREGDK